MKNNISSDNDEENSVEIEESEESFLSYLLNKYDEDRSENKSEFEQTFNEFLQKENCAVSGTNELSLNKLILVSENANTDMIVFDNKKFRYLIEDKDVIPDIIKFILDKKIVNSSGFLSLGKLLAKEIVERNNDEQKINNDESEENEQDKQSENEDNENVEWTRNEYKKQIMSVIEKRMIVFDLKLQKKMLPDSQCNRIDMSNFMPGSINDSSVLLELLKKGRDGGVDGNNVVTESNICKFENNSINCLDNLLDYSDAESTQEIDFDNLKLKLMDSSIWSLSELFKYFDKIDLYDLGNVTEEQINASKVKKFLSDLGNLKYFAQEAFLELFDDETSLLSDSKVCRLLNVKGPQDEKDSVWKLKLKLAVMYIVTFGFYHFLEYDKEALDEISKAEYLSGDYFEKIRANYLKPEGLLSIILKNNKRSTEKLAEVRKNATEAMGKVDLLEKDKVNPLRNAVTKLKKDNISVNKRIQTLETSFKKYKEDQQKQKVESSGSDKSENSSSEDESEKNKKKNNIKNVIVKVKKKSENSNKVKPEMQKQIKYKNNSEISSDSD